MTVTSERPAASATELLHVDPFAHVTRYGDDEIFVRRGSRSVYSRLIRDAGRRRLLAPVTEDLMRPCTIIELRERYAGRAADIDEIVAMLDAEGLLRRMPTAGAVAAGDAPSGSPVRLLGAGPIATVLAEILDKANQVPVECVWEGVTAPPREPAHRVDDLLDADLGELLAGARLAVVLADGIRPGLSHAVNVAAAEASVPWLNVAVDGSEVLVGPIVVPGQTACFNCFDIFDESGRQHRNDFLIYKDQLREGRPIPVRPTHAYLTAAWAAQGVEQFARDGRSFLIERVLRVDTERMEVITERVFQLPRCPVCSRGRPDLRHTFL